LTNLDDITVILVFAGLILIICYTIFWAIGTVFGIFGYKLNFWQNLAAWVLFLIWILARGGSSND